MANGNKSENKCTALQQLLGSFAQMSNILLCATQTAAFWTAHVDYYLFLHTNTSYVPLIFMPDKWRIYDLQYTGTVITTPALTEIMDW
jgi:hypothetical protein